MSEDNNNNNNPFNEKTIVQSSRPSPKDDVPPSIGADKTMVFAKSNLQDTFDAKTVVRSSKPVAPATLPDEAPARVIAAELPPPPQDADTNPDVRLSSAVLSAEKPKLSREERREARAALDRKTKTYVMAFGAVVALAIVIVAATLAGSGTEKATSESPKVANEAPVSAGQKSELASEADPEKVKNANMLGAYKTTTDVLKDFDRASQKAQDHSVGF